MFDFINGNKFCDFATYSIFPWDNLHWTNDILRKNAIIYVKTDFIQDVFNQLKFSSNKYVLITHMSDYAITENIFKSRPSCIKKWFAQNAVYDHPDLIPIPIGIENHKGNQKGKSTDHQWLSENLEILRANPKNEKILYCNWYTPNNPVARTGILQKLRNNNVQYIWDRQGGEEDNKENDNKIAKLTYYQYCDHVSRYKFMVCPPGHGVSIHQPFEAMYFGCVPIVIRHRIYNNCEDMPMIQVNDWTEVNYNLLEAYNNKIVNNEKIYMPYWENLITTEFNKL